MSFSSYFPSNPPAASSPLHLVFHPPPYPSSSPNLPHPHPLPPKDSLLLTNSQLSSDHCADLLRQKLQCDSDVGIYTYNWVKDHKRPYPNFNTRHKCRNFDDILRWGRAHEAKRPDTESGQPERGAWLEGVDGGGWEVGGGREMEMPP